MSLFKKTLYDIIYNTHDCDMKIKKLKYFFSL